MLSNNRRKWPTWLMTTWAFRCSGCYLCTLPLRHMMMLYLLCAMKTVLIQKADDDLGSYYWFSIFSLLGLLGLRYFHARDWSRVHTVCSTFQPTNGELKWTTDLPLRSDIMTLNINNGCHWSTSDLKDYFYLMIWLAVSPDSDIVHTDAPDSPVVVAACYRCGACQCSCCTVCSRVLRVYATVVQCVTIVVCGMCYCCTPCYYFAVCYCCGTCHWCGACHWCGVCYCCGMCYLLLYCVPHVWCALPLWWCW